MLFFDKVAKIAYKNNFINKMLCMTALPARAGTVRVEGSESRAGPQDACMSSGFTSHPLGLPSGPYHPDIGKFVLAAQEE